MKQSAIVMSVRRRPIGAMLIFVMALVQVGCAAQDSPGKVELGAYDFTYQSYAQLLKEYVRDGFVDYANIQQNRAGLDSLVTGLASADLANASRDQRLAFYCNAYNILTIRSIVDAYPVSSIKDIDGVWDKQSWLVAGKKLTLNEIEHQILRKEFREPRIHVAVNCASIGCPPLLEVPYYPDRLDSLLTVSAQRFAASKVHNWIDPEKQIAHLSAIFDWFGDDFIDQYYVADKYPGLDRKTSAALNFVVLHLQDETAAKVSSQYTVEYLDYDWGLNELSQ